MDIEKFEIDPFVISDLIISGGGLVCSHCGRRITIEELLDYKILIGNEEGYLSHIECLINYVMKAEPVISSGLASGLFSESEIRQNLLSRPFESVILDISRACSFKHLSPLTEKCSKFIASESTLIETRNNQNLEILLDYLDNAFQDPIYSDIN